MKNKTCTWCHKEKELDAFGIEKKGKYGRRSKCRDCRSRTEKQDSEYRRQHYQDNLEHIRGWRKDYYHKNPDGFREKRLEHYYANKTSEFAYMRKYIKRRRKTDPMFRLNSNIGGGIWYALKGNKNGCPWESLVGYTLDELKISLEGKFTEGMNWDNYGKWHVDHVKPKALFNYTKATDHEFMECWALDNLQPLWVEDNLRKSARYDEN